MRPDAFAAVMATGIVSIAAEDHSYHVISDVLAVLAATGLIVLVVIGVFAWRREPVFFWIALAAWVLVAARVAISARYRALRAG